MSLWLSFTKTIPLLIINFDYFTINISLNIPDFSFQSRNEIDAALGKYKEIASIQTDIAELWNNIGLCFFKKQKLIVVSGLDWNGVEGGPVDFSFENCSWWSLHWSYSFGWPLDFHSKYNHRLTDWRTNFHAILFLGYFISTKSHLAFSLEL